MPHRSGTPLTLVAVRPEPSVRDRDPADGAVRQPSLPDLGTDSPADRIPFVVHLTTEQILQVADDAEIRAEILDGVSGAFRDRRRIAFRRGERTESIDRRVSSLRRVADDLRGIASQMMDDWD